MLQPNANFKLHLITQMINLNFDNVGTEAQAILEEMGNVIDFGHNPWADDCSCEMCAKPCEQCGEMVPHDEHCGNEKADGTSEYLCEGCYVPEIDEEEEREYLRHEAEYAASRPWMHN